MGTCLVRHVNEVKEDHLRAFGRTLHVCWLWVGRRWAGFEACCPRLPDVSSAKATQNLHKSLKHTWAVTWADSSARTRASSSYAIVALASPMKSKAKQFHQFT